MININVEDTKLFLNLLNPLLATSDGFDRFTYLSENWSDTLGFSIKELMSISTLDLVHPEDKNRTFKEIMKINREKKTVNFINRYQKKDGSYLWISWNSQRVKEGKVYLTALDITYTLNIQKQLTQSIDLSDHLTPTEFAIFELLKLKSPKSVTKANLINAVYSDRKVDPMTINVHISNLKNKLSKYKYNIESRGKGRWTLKPLS